MAVHWETSADPGAVSIYGANGRLNTWWKQHQVTNRGWTNPYTTTNIDVFLPPGSTGNGIRLAHDSSISGAAQRATIRGFESASGVSTLVDPYPTTLQVGDTASTIVASSTADTTPRPWWALSGDFTGPYDSFVILVVQISASAVEWFFYGRPFLDDPTDVHGWLIGVRNAANNLPTAHTVAVASGATPNQRFFWQRSVDGTVKSTTSLFVTAYGGGGSGTLGISQNTTAYVTGVGAKMRMNQQTVGCSGNTSNTVTTGKNTPWRGIIPNLWIPAHSSYSGITNADTSFDTGYDALAQFIAFGMGFTATTLTTGVIVLEKTDTWRPEDFA